MKIFGKCLWHSWIYKDKYYDCSDICIWSSGTSYYRQCKCCGETQEDSTYKGWEVVTDQYALDVFKEK